MSLDHLTIASVGLGRIGAGIARNLQASGCRCVVYNRTPARMDPFVAGGAQPARSAREAAAGADFVVTSLMDDQSVLDVLSGEDGILAGLRRDAVHIGTSTISPGCSTRCAGLHYQHGSHYLAAPAPRLRESCSPSFPESQRSSNVPGRCWLPTHKAP